jgi:cysteine desulfurase/selenocysteine lyase
VSDKNIRRQFPILRGGEHYLDSAASALMPAAVLDATAAFDSAARANVARGVYRWAEEATAAYEGARADVAKMLGANSCEVVFTGGATAGLNLLAYCLSENLGSDDAVILSRAEHHSNIVPWQRRAQARGFSLRYADCEDDGAISLNSLARVLEEENKRGKARVVSLVHTSNVTGAVLDLQKAAAIIHDAGALFAVDGAQAAPHASAVNIAASGADFYVFSGHKCYAPNGVGVLWGREELLNNLPPFMSGGGMVGEVRDDDADFIRAPRRLEAGTPPITPAVGLGAAMRWMQSQDWRAINQNGEALCQALINGITKIPQTRILGALDATGRMPIVAFTAAGAHPHDICQLLGERGIATRGGHHCAQLLMRHFGVAGCVRAGIGPYNVMEDIQALLDALGDALDILR